MKNKFEYKKDTFLSILWVFFQIKTEYASKI